MSTPIFFQNRKILFAANTIFWLMLCVLELIQNYYFSTNYGEEFNFFQRASWAGSYYFSLWVLSIFIYRIFLFTSEKPIPKILLIHFPISLIFGTLLLLLSVFLTTYIRVEYDGQHDGELFPAYLDMLKMVYPLIVNGFLMYWLVLIILMALDLYKKYRNQYTFSVELESKLTKSQLQTLKMQLQPHFLFNAMNTISMMIRRNKDEEAIEMISGLSDMLRSTLTKEGKQMVTLAEEIDLLKKYLKIEQVRFQDTLNVNFDIDQESLTSEVPSLILQPILENAFKHGISKSLGNSQISIISKLTEGSLFISIFNSGPGLPEDWDLDSIKGIGLKNTKNRLEQLYGNHYTLKITNKDRGTVVELNFPATRETV